MLVSKKTNMKFIIISRGDSTLRGHYPIETETIKEALGENIDGEILIPFFQEGGRVTIDNIHYVKENNNYIPVGETEFSLDPTFGFTKSHLGEWIEEKTKGKYKADDCIYIKIEDSYQEIVRKLSLVNNFNKIIVNASTYNHLRFFCIALETVMSNGKTFLFRTAASFPKVIGEIADKELIDGSSLISKENLNGGLVIVGSHVKKTTQQLKFLMDD